MNVKINQSSSLTYHSVFPSRFFLQANFILLLKDLKEALHANGMILSAAVSAGKATIDPAYDVPGMAQQLDMVNLMAYDLHGAWDTYTHHQSGLYVHPEDTGDNLYLNQVTNQ